MITEQEYRLLKNKYDTYHKARKEYMRKHKTNGIPVGVIDLPSPTNDEVSSIEVYEFVTNPPDKYILYVDLPKRIVTTWTGELLGKIISTGKTHRSNMGDTRIPIRIKAINGKEYYGTFYQSAGDYARIEMYKEFLP